MKISSSFRQLLRNLDSAAKIPPSWVLLLSGQGVNQHLWTAQCDEIIPAPDADKIAPTLKEIPIGGRHATSQVPWAAELTKTIFAPHENINDYLILPIHQGSDLVACVGWNEETRTTHTIMANATAVRRAFCTSWALENARSECQALRWVLSRCDRLVAAVRPGGEIVGLSPLASDFLKSLQVGPYHYFHTGEPGLPTHLVQAIAKMSAGQVKLSKSCTARFDRIGSTSDAWQPVIGVELFVEKAPPVHLPPPISLLTPVERQIYELIKTGATNMEISRLRGTAFATTKNQVSTILAKMGVPRRHLLISGASPTHCFAQLDNPGMNGAANSRR